MMIAISFLRLSLCRIILEISCSLPKRDRKFCFRFVDLIIRRIHITYLRNLYLVKLGFVPPRTTRYNHQSFLVAAIVQSIPHAVKMHYKNIDFSSSVNTTVGGSLSIVCYTFVFVDAIYPNSKRSGR